MADVPNPQSPSLMVVVDTEEEFDWGRSFSRTETRVDHMRHQHRAQRIWERYGVKPTYVVDFPIASQESGYAVLRDWSGDGKCEIGAHLHPWVNPPFEEMVSTRNSYPGNLSAQLERTKLMILTDMIERNFGERPRVYKAGRYGIGQATASVLDALGYEIDVSVVPHTDFTAAEGPDFTAFDATPFWFGPFERLLEIPLTVGWCGRWRALGSRVQPWLMSPRALRLHAPGVCARLGLLERVRLTPEGVSFSEMKRLIDTMLKDGRRLFHLTYHSPSVQPGNTPYVRDAHQLEVFLGTIASFCEYFFGSCGGKPVTPHQVRAELMERPRSRQSMPELSRDQADGVAAGQPDAVHVH